MLIYTGSSSVARLEDGPEPHLYVRLWGPDICSYRWLTVGAPSQQKVQIYLAELCTGSPMNTVMISKAGHVPFAVIIMHATCVRPSWKDGLLDIIMEEYMQTSAQKRNERIITQQRANRTGGKERNRGVIHFISASTFMQPQPGRWSSTASCVLKKKYHGIFFVT